MALLKNSTKILKNWDQFYKHKIEEKERFTNSFYEANITLICKLDRVSQNRPKTTDQYL